MQKRYFCTLLVVCVVMSMLVCPVSAATDSGTFGNDMAWTYDSETATVTISGTGTLTGLITDSGQGYLKYNLDARHLVIAEGITEITSGSFYRAFYNLESIWIADSVVTIGNMAFANSITPKQLRLGKGIKTIGEGAFMTCEELESLILPAGLQSIGADAFSLSGIKALAIPEGITVLEPGSFRSSKNLTRLAVPTSVTHIKDGAFRDCTSLKDVYYAGTKAQWEAINLENRNEIAGDATTGGNAPLVTATIHYNHTHSYTEEKVTVAADCGEEGEKLRICVCGAAEIRAIPKLSQHAWDNGSVTKAASCAKEGEKTYTCTVCKNTKTETIAKTSTHVWNAGTQNADTTVTYSCTLCNTVKREGTAVTEPASKKPIPTEAAPVESAPTEATPVESAPTETTPTERISTEPTSTGTAYEAPAVDSGDVTQKQTGNFPWVAVCIGAAVLLAAAGALIWLQIRKKA